DWGRVTTTFAAFQITQQNNMVVMEPGNTLPTLTRNGEQRNRGIELNAYGEVTNGVRLLGGLTLLEARQTKTQDGAFDGERAESAPAVRAVIGAEWDAPVVEGLTLSGRFTYTGDQVINNGSPDFKIRSWTQLD